MDLTPKYGTEVSPPISAFGRWRPTKLPGLKEVARG